MPFSNLIEYSDSYSDREILLQFKRNEGPNKNADLTIDNSLSFKYKAALVGKTADAAGGNSSVNIEIFEQFLEIIRNAINQPQNSSWTKMGCKAPFYILLEILQISK